MLLQPRQHFLFHQSLHFMWHSRKRDKNFFIGVLQSLPRKAEDLEGASNHIPGAVPLSFINTVQTSGTSACFRFLSKMGPGRRKIFSNKYFTCASTCSFTMSLPPKYLQRRGFVISSAVGPSPPVIKMMSACSFLRPMHSRYHPKHHPLQPGVLPIHQFYLTLQPSMHCLYQSFGRSVVHRQ